MHLSTVKDEKETRVERLGKDPKPEDADTLGAVPEFIPDGRLDCLASLCVERRKIVKSRIGNKNRRQTQEVGVKVSVSIRVI